MNDIRQHGRITIGYISAFGLLLVSFLLTMFANKQLIKKGESVEHSNKIITNLGSLYSVVSHAETGYRGFLASGDAQFLLAHAGSRQKADSIFKETLPLLKGSIAQQSILKKINESLGRNYDIIERQLKVLPVAASSPASANLQETDAIYKLMEQVRSDVLTMQAVEKRLLIERNVDVRKTSVAVTTIIVASIVIAFLLVLFAFYAHLKENKQRVQAEQEVIDYQDALNKRIRELAVANKRLVVLKGQEKFAAAGRIALIIAHEIRNPLTNINLANEQLNLEFGADESARFLFKVIERNSERINHLVTELLSSTKFSDLKTEKVPLNDMMEEALLAVKEQLSLKKLKLVTKYQNVDCDVLVDKAKIKVALVNIISNAVYGRDDKEDAEFIIETRRNENKTCTITITDTGKGMNEEEVATVFEPNFTHKLNAQGLALIKTQNIILNHKGDIAVKSRQELGTSFTITLNTVCE